MAERYDSVLPRGNQQVWNQSAVSSSAIPYTRIYLVQFTLTLPGNFGLLPELSGTGEEPPVSLKEQYERMGKAMLELSMRSPGHIPAVVPENLAASDVASSNLEMVYDFQSDFHRDLLIKMLPVTTATHSVSSTFEH